MYTLYIYTYTRYIHTHTHTHTHTYRYVTSRKLPDKAIDLIDEACASVRVQLDSQPEIIDRLERKRLQEKILNRQNIVKIIGS